MESFEQAASISEGATFTFDWGVRMPTAQAVARSPADIPIFEPQDLAWLEKAFDGAVAIAADEDGPFVTLPAHELRRRLASAVLDAASHGVRDVALLRAHALRTVAAQL